MIKRLLFVILAGTLPNLAQAASVPINYTGHYELADPHHTRVFTFDLNQSGSRVHVAFFAALLDDQSAKPSGEGQGRINDEGILQFNFKDSFANEGTATFEPLGHGYQVEMRITKFVDPAPLHFYGLLTVKKTSDKVQTVASST